MGNHFAADTGLDRGHTRHLPDHVLQLLLERGLIPAESAKQPVNASLAQKFRDGASDMVITAMNTTITNFIYLFSMVC